jgi:hypothetical protein
VLRSCSVHGFTILAFASPRGSRRRVATLTHKVHRRSSPFFGRIVQMSYFPATLHNSRAAIRDTQGTRQRQARHPPVGPGYPSGSRPSALFVCNVGRHPALG